MAMIQNFRRRGVPELSGLPTLPPAVNLDDPREWPQVAAPGVEHPVQEYAPRRSQSDVFDIAVTTITTFAALPTKEIDDTILALKDELAEIEADAQRVRNAYVEVTDRLLRHMERQKAVHKIARTAFAAMRDQCGALDQPELPLEPPAPEPEKTDKNEETGG